MTYDTVLVALADPTRRAILELLKGGPSAVGELADQLPVSRAAVSQHLRVLKDAQLVSETAMGTRHIYRAEPKGLMELRRYLESFWGQMLFAYAKKADKRPSRKFKKAQDRRQKP